MAAMYAPNALEPARWIPGDGFHLQTGGPPYRILKRQKFDFLSSREVLIFEGCRALYRPPGQPGIVEGTAAAGEWIWDGAIRVWVQVNFAPPTGLLRRGTDLLCGEDSSAPTVASGTTVNARQNASLNILPEVLDRAVFPDFEIVILDMRGGQSLTDVQTAGWADSAVPTPFSAAGAITVLRRLLELNVLLSQSGLCLANLHPDQLMIDTNLNIRIRGIPLIAPVQPDGNFAADCRAELAARAARDLVLSM
ncbi:MAG TPA: hypothetical protein VL860_04990, partial [Planctomycetota bacterium]|nr:hypothetical protein [Planctomycetota bacterium]